MKLTKELFVYGAILFLVSCTAYTVTSSPGSTDAPFTTSVTEPPPSTTVTTTTLPVSSPTSLIVPTSTPSAQLEEEQPTTLPTISPDAVQPFVLELTNDNQNCLLPCFWNITPGETEWQNAEAFLSTFAYSISYGTTDGTFADVPIGDSFMAWMYLLLPEISNVPFNYAFDVRDGIIMMVDTFILPVTNNTLPDILNKYGQPSEIWLLTASTPMDGDLGFRLSLFYAQQHFMLKYGGNGEVVDGKVHGCLSGEEESLHLVAWSPEEELSFAEAVNGLHKPRSIIYDLPLREATGMSGETFYETFRNANKPVCLQTPTELWPNP